MLRISCFAIAAAAAVIGVSSVAEAACTRLAFSVNDYGKEGPARDAQQLLDKYIAQWTAERGIKKYKVGKKDVSCELFLNFIVFDEHTCKAEASVCWEGKEVPDPLPAKASPASSPAPEKKSAPKAAEVKPAQPKKTE
jgi:hypothetical protein